MAGTAIAEAMNGKLVPHPNRGDLRWELEQIRKAARAVPALRPEERRSVTAPIVTFMRERFLPRADAEEAAIHPKLDRAFSRDVTAALVFDHLMIEGHTAELAAADSRDGARLQELLYGLHALIKSHLAREQDVYVRLLFRGGGATGAPPEEASAAA
jgi:hypothetical protein